MSRFEVPQPIQNSPYEEPKRHWNLEEGKEPELAEGRRMALYYYRPPTTRTEAQEADVGTAIELKLVTRIRDRLGAWRAQQWPGVTRTTRELLDCWRRDERKQRLFFAQIEAAETIVFLTEARADFLHGIDVPWDEPGDEKRAQGAKAFRRYACKMATGSGKTTVMGMLAAWTILNKVHSRGDARFSDVVLIVCPNVTIRERLGELDPTRGEASLYRTRELVPLHLLPDLAQGRVVVTNWHALQRCELQVSGVSARVTRLGKPERIEETVLIGPRTQVARGKRYMTLEDFRKQRDSQRLSVLAEEFDERGELKRVRTERFAYLESDKKLVTRVLGSSKRNVFVMNDEAHHAYRIRRKIEDEDDEDEDVELDRDMDKEATVWIDGLDRVHALRTIQTCVDLSATPYYLASSGPEGNRPFPWVVSDFGLVDAIESGLVKIPQFAVRDTSGDKVPGYFNIWSWILPQLNTAERGGARGSVKPEAILKWAVTPLTMVAGLWQRTFEQWRAEGEPRPPVLIIVCKTIQLARVVFDWLAEGKAPHGIQPARIPELRNEGGRENTIRADTRVVHDTDSGEAKSDSDAWMRFQLDTVGQQEWPRDLQGRDVLPPGFRELAEKLGKPLDPPGRDVRCIVSVAMLTEGWDCRTVTHIVGLRPFMSQLLCEQVVGRGLRRQHYTVGADDRLSEEVAKILGVPFHVVPFKETEGGEKVKPPKRHQVCALPERAARYEIRFPRVEGYTQAIRDRIEVDWSSISPLALDPSRIPPEIEMKATLPTNAGRPSLLGPGRLESVDLSAFRSGVRRQELEFAMAADLTREYAKQPSCSVPAHRLFTQLVRVVARYVDTKVIPVAPAQRVDVFLAPYYGWAVERLAQAIRPDSRAGEAPELPIYERSRGAGSTADVDFWTSRDVRETTRSHVNYVVADTPRLEQQTGAMLDRHPSVAAYVKNAGLGFAIPYLHNGQLHEYLPDFIVRLRGSDHGHEQHLILETKGFDPLADVKREAAQRWVDAVNAEGSFGCWRYALVKSADDAATAVEETTIAV